MRELDAVKQEASLLREQMQIVKNDIEKVNKWKCFSFCLFNIAF